MEPDGAAPEFADDADALYHVAYDATPDRLRALLDRGVPVEGTNAIAAALDTRRVEHVRLLVDAMREPLDTQGPLVAHAVRRGCGIDVLEVLAEGGASLTRPGAEVWRGDVPYRTPYEHAVLRGRDDVAGWLAERGAAAEVSDADRAVAAVARGERPPGPAFPPLDALDPDRQEALILAALDGQLDAVVAAVGAGFHGVVAGSPDVSLRDTRRGWGTTRSCGRSRRAAASRRRRA